MHSIDNNLIIQILLVIISLAGLICYYYAYKIGTERRNNNGSFKLPIRLYFISSYPALIWYILPFLSQPRITGIVNMIVNRDFSVFSLVYSLVCLCVFLYFFVFWGNQSVTKNYTATKDTFFAPKKLLTDGIYGKVQHPMVSGDMICHFSMALLAGGLYTLLLFPVYILIDIIIVNIQVKYSLEPYFAEELKAYRKRTPAYFNKNLFAVVSVLIILMVLNIGFNFNWI